MTTLQLVTTLKDIINSIESGDSFEGGIQYTCIHMDEELKSDEWEVNGAYRVGNKDGQGGMIILNEEPII